MNTVSHNKNALIPDTADTDTTVTTMNANNIASHRNDENKQNSIFYQASQKEQIISNGLSRENSNVINLERAALTDVTSKINNRYSIGSQTLNMNNNNTYNVNNLYYEYQQNITNTSSKVPYPQDSEAEGEGQERDEEEENIDEEVNNVTLETPEIHENQEGGQDHQHYDEYEDQLRPMMPVVTKSDVTELTDIFNKFYTPKPDPMDEDTYDATMVVEYAPEIFNYLHKQELKLSPDPLYMDYQPELKWKYRATLFNWLVKAHEKFNLLQETLYLTVNIIDRFLSHTEIAVSKFHLVGATCLFIASKYEEINCPTLKEIMRILDNEYTAEQVMRAERYILCALEFELGWPGPMPFLRRISKADDYNYDIRTLAKYLLETTIMDQRFVGSPPSWLAAGAYYLSIVILENKYWTESHVYYSGYTEKQITPVASIIAQNCRDPNSTHEAIYKKYSERRHRRCSQLVSRWIAAIEMQQEQQY
ncbi:cyclin family protein SCDLUD_000250 [Saccharomycodes ludwigii]|uniref:cyclin family protein n=1 Tax=Saccharomycodes ludwigii TaxID=36035 RepID=UPI001E85AF1E|nr:hypothetical protein SCDLUD_000250 [Saccharomycodes ludwigii]KAH3902667.1 hypothetical protein SCDLUD_000250 [Saccharomycodes ludwigii]